MGSDRVRLPGHASTRASRACSALLTMLLAFAIAPASQAGAASFGAAAWGYNGSGQLGDGSTAISRTPVSVSGLTGVTAVAAGGEHSLALLSNGTVMAWGANRDGQLGTGTTVSSHVPVAVSGLSGVVAIAAGKADSMALLGNGTVMSWGANEQGQLGTGKTTRSLVPVAVKGLSGVSSVAAGAEFDLARMSDGTVMSWGANEEGQLGNGKKTKSLIPVAVKGLSGVTAVAAGAEHALALLGNGTVMSWGSNQSRQLGTPARLKKIGGGEPEEEPEYEEIEDENSSVPVPVQALAGVTAISAGLEHSLALLGEGTVMAWGGNATGQLGNGTGGGSSNHPSPVNGIASATAIAAGSRHSLARLSDGTLVGWGYNPDGQLGNGSNVNSTLPVAVEGIAGVAGIAAGGAHTLSFGPPFPSVSGVSPSSGPEAGGTSVTISGANLGEASAVRFGASAAASFVVSSATSITAVAPPGAGAVDVTVTTPLTTSSATAADRFTYLPPPAVLKVGPTKGPAAGGTSVTITGTGLTGATAVRFGASPASSFTVSSPTSIAAVSPPGTSGTVDITLSTPSGTSPVDAHDHFKYEYPTVQALSPGAGSSAGGTAVTVTGSGFAPGTGTTVFKFASVPATAVECSSSTTCVLVTPPSKPRTVDVKAVVGKTSSKTVPPGDLFTYG